MNKLVFTDLVCSALLKTKLSGDFNTGDLIAISLWLANGNDIQPYRLDVQSATPSNGFDHQSYIPLLTFENPYVPQYSKFIVLRYDSDVQKLIDHARANLDTVLTELCERDPFRGYADKLIKLDRMHSQPEPLEP